MERLTLGKDRKLLSNEQFKRVLAGRISARDRLLTLYIAPNRCGFSRIGISIGKVYGNAVARNRLKRLLREAFRQHQNEIPSGFDYLLTISKSRSRPEGSSVKKTEPEIEKISASLLKLVKIAYDRLDNNSSET